MRPMLLIAWFAVGALAGVIDVRRGGWRHTWVVTAVFGPLAVTVLQGWGRARPPEIDPPLDRMAGRRVLVGIDGRDAGNAALEAILEVLDPDSTNLVLAAVVDRDAASWPDRAPGLLDPGEPRELVDARAALEAAASVAKRAGFRVQTIVLGGPPASTLATFAGTHQFDAVVLGQHRVSLASIVFGGCRPRDFDAAGIPVVAVRNRLRPRTEGHRTPAAIVA